MSSCLWMQTFGMQPGTNSQILDNRFTIASECLETCWLHEEDGWLLDRGGLRVSCKTGKSALQKHRLLSSSCCCFLNLFWIIPPPQKKKRKTVIAQYLSMFLYNCIVYQNERGKKRLGLKGIALELNTSSWLLLSVWESGSGSSEAGWPTVPSLGRRSAPAWRGDKSEHRDETRLWARPGPELQVSE